MLTPRPYQIEGRDFLAARRFALLADEMRVGKTPQAILAAGKVDAESIIVVCPAIAVHHWNRELDAWWPARGRNGRAFVMSYDRFRLENKMWLARHYDLAIVDECHFAKNPEAQRTKLIYGKGGLGYVSDRMWVLSGTPMINHPAELWPMLRAFGVVGMGYDEFIKRYCTIDWMSQRPNGTRVQMIPELRELLAKVMLRRTRAEVAPDMPKIDFQFLEVKPDSAADLTAPPGLSDEDFVAWLEAHPTYDAENRVAVANAKVAPLFENIRFSIENGLLKQTVVFGWHVEPLTRLAAMLNNAGIQAAVLNGATTPRNKAIIQRQFHEGFTKVICANILSAGTAIDLSPARHGYFLELDWTSVNNVQAANRLISLDKLDKVTVDCITVPGSVDDRVQRILVKKAQSLRQIGLA